jgi:hypothetical protein
LCVLPPPLAQQQLLQAVTHTLARFVVPEAESGGVGGGCEEDHVPTTQECTVSMGSLLHCVLSAKGQGLHLPTQPVRDSSSAHSKNALSR